VAGSTRQCLDSFDSSSKKKKKKRKRKRRKRKRKKREWKQPKQTAFSQLRFCRVRSGPMLSVALSLRDQRSSREESQQKGLGTKRRRVKRGRQ